MTNSIDLGSGQSLWPAFDGTGPDARLLGYARNHPDARKSFVMCDSFIWLVPGEGRAVKTVVQAEPLTLEPSSLCTACGSHGYVREGKWIPA